MKANTNLTTLQSSQSPKGRGLFGGNFGQYLINRWNLLPVVGTTSELYELKYPDIDTEDLIDLKTTLMALGWKPWHLMPNISDFGIKLNKFNPLLFTYGILARYKPTLTYKEGLNQDRIAYLLKIQIRLAKYKANQDSLRYWKLAFLLIMKSDTYLVNCMHAVDKNLYRMKTYAELKEIIRNINKIRGKFSRVALAQMKFKRRYLPEPDKMRPLGVPTLEWRIYGNMLLNPLVSWCEIDKGQHGFRPGYGTLTAIKELFSNVYRSKYIYEVDLKQCFPSINLLALETELVRAQNVPYNVARYYSSLNYNVPFLKEVAGDEYQTDILTYMLKLSKYKNNKMFNYESGLFLRKPLSVFEGKLFDYKHFTRDFVPVGFLPHFAIVETLKAGYEFDSPESQYMDLVHRNPKLTGKMFLSTYNLRTIGRPVNFPKAIVPTPESMFLTEDLILSQIRCFNKYCEVDMSPYSGEYLNISRSVISDYVQDLPSSSDLVRMMTSGDPKDSAFMTELPMEMYKLIGIAQGGPCSPFLAIVLLNEFFKSLPSHVKYLAYADDFILYGNDVRIVNFVETELKPMLLKFGLRLHPTKSMWVKVNNNWLSHAFKFLSIVYDPFSDLLYSKTRKGNTLVYNKDYLLEHEYDILHAIKVGWESLDLQGSRLVLIASIILARGTSSFRKYMIQLDYGNWMLKLAALNRHFKNQRWLYDVYYFIYHMIRWEYTLLLHFIGGNLQTFNDKIGLQKFMSLHLNSKGEWKHNDPVLLAKYLYDLLAPNGVSYVNHPLIIEFYTKGYNIFIPLLSFSRLRVKLYYDVFKKVTQSTKSIIPLDIHILDSVLARLYPVLLPSQTAMLDYVPDDFNGYLSRYRTKYRFQNFVNSRFNGLLLSRLYIGKWHLDDIIQDFTFGFKEGSIGAYLYHSSGGKQDIFTGTSNSISHLLLLIKSVGTGPPRKTSYYDVDPPIGTLNTIFSDEIDYGM